MHIISKAMVIITITNNIVTIVIIATTITPAIHIITTKLPLLACNTSYGIPSFSIPSTSTVFLGNVNSGSYTALEVCSTPTNSHPIPLTHSSHPTSPKGVTSKIGTHYSEDTLIPANPGSAVTPKRGSTSICALNTSHDLHRPAKFGILSIKEATRMMGCLPGMGRKV